MKCPYLVSHVKVFSDHYNYDNDGHVVSENYISDELSIPNECIKEECAAWKDEKCVKNNK